MKKVLSMKHLFRLSLILYVLTWLTACGASATELTKKEDLDVMIRVASGEEYKIRLTEPADIEIAHKLLAGEEAPRIPNGVVVRREPDIISGYTWHIDPESVEFADFTVEVCDGLP